MCWLFLAHNRRGDQALSNQATKPSITLWALCLRELSPNPFKSHDLKSSRQSRPWWSFQATGEEIKLNTSLSGLLWVWACFLGEFFFISYLRNPAFKGLSSKSFYSFPWAGPSKINATMIIYVNRNDKPFFITSLLERNTSPSQWGELIGVLLNQSCTSCYVNLIFTRRQFNLLWVTLPRGGQKDLIFAAPGGAITSEIITGIPAGVICLQPQLMLCKFLAQVCVPEHLFAAKI